MFHHRVNETDFLDVEPFEQLFQSCIRKDTEDVHVQLLKIRKANPDLVPYAPIAVIAAHEGLSMTLQLCLDKGVKFDRYLARACADGGRRYPEVERVVALYEDTIRKLPRGRMAPDGNFTAEQLVEWFGGINW